MLRQCDALLLVIDLFDRIDRMSTHLACLGEPYFEREEKHKTYAQYHRDPHQRRRRSKALPSSSSSSSSEEEEDQSPPWSPSPSHTKRRAKRQLDFDPMAKHVEVLVAYDHSIKEFHSDADIKSYILTAVQLRKFSSSVSLHRLSLLLV